MANRFILNETSYFGAGARENTATEIKARGLKKIMFVTDNCVIAKVLKAEEVVKTPYLRAYIKKAR